MAQQTSLAAAITTVGQSSITVTDPVGFPDDTVPFDVLIDAEVLTVSVGGVGETTWTVTRGAQGTTAATHLINATVTHVPAAYGELDDLLPMLALGADTSRYELLLTMLADTSRDIDAACMRSFAVPTVDETFYVDIEEWEDCLSEASEDARTTDGRALDFVSITNLYVRADENSPYVELTAGDTTWWLEPGPPGTGVAGTDWPWEDVELSRWSTTPVFPVGRKAVKIVGRLGFPAIPDSVKRACLAETAERFRQTIGGGPAQIGVTAFGSPIFLTGDSPAMRRILRDPFSRRPVAA